MQYNFFQSGLQEGGGSGKKAAYKTYKIKGDKIDNDYNSGGGRDGLGASIQIKNPKAKQNGGGRGLRAAAPGLATLAPPLRMLTK